MQHPEIDPATVNEIFERVKTSCQQALATAERAHINERFIENLVLVGIHRSVSQQLGQHYDDLGSLSMDKSERKREIVRLVGPDDPKELSSLIDNTIQAVLDHWRE